jgi:glycosyltransferase involved in cell wall biosynthesis
MELPWQLCKVDHIVPLSYFVGLHIVVVIIKRKDEMQTNKLFSIIIPTRNRPELLRRALSSIVVQLNSNYEVIVINDGSTVSYESIRKEYQSYIDHYITAADPTGVAGARNKGIRIAKGDWVIFLDDDDELDSEYLFNLERKVSRLNDYDKKCFFWSSVKILNYKSGSSPSVSLLEFSKISSGKELVEVAASTIGASYGLVIKNSLVSDDIFFNTNFTYAEDTEFIINIMSQGYSPEYLSELVVIKHDHNSGRLSDDFNLYSNHMVYEKILDLHQGYFKNNPAVYAKIQAWCSLTHFKNGKIVLGTKAYLGHLKAKVFSCTL